MRDNIKSVARALAFVAVIPPLLSYSLRSVILGKDRALEGSTQLLALLPGVFGQYLRQAFLARTLRKCAPTATVCFGTIFSKSGAMLDDRVYIGPGCFLGLVHLEQDVLVGAGVHITSGPRTHGTRDATRPIREQQGEPTLVRIGAGSWVGSGAIVMADVGANSVIAAGSVVTKPVPDAVMAAGVPAVVVKSRL
jgi:virginiamycin A acetyltransferase